MRRSLLHLLHLALALQPASASVVAVQPALLVWQRALAGAGAYCAATLVTAPMDCVKVRAQAERGLKRSSSWRVAAEMMKREGLVAFFAGIAPALMMAPAAMVQYSMIDPLRARFPLYLAAMIAGGLDITIKTPFDRLKTQMQKEGHSKDETMVSLLHANFQENGIRGLWKGYSVTLARDLPYLILKWLVFVQAQSLLSLSTFGWLAVEARNLVAGALAGGVAAIAVTPADVIKTRMQVATASGGAQRGSLSTARSVVSEDGLLGLFRGIGPRLARIPFYTAVTLATFELIKDLFMSTARAAAEAAAQAM